MTSSFFNEYNQNTINHETINHETVNLRLEVVKMMLTAADSTPDHIEKLLSECKKSLEECCFCAYIEQKRTINVNRDFLSDYAIADLADLLIEIIKERKI